MLEIDLFNQFINQIKKIPKNSKKFQKIPKNSKKFQKIPNNSKKFQKSQTEVAILYDQGQVPLDYRSIVLATELTLVKQ